MAVLSLLLILTLCASPSFADSSVDAATFRAAINDLNANVAERLQDDRFTQHEMQRRLQSIRAEAAASLPPGVSNRAGSFSQSPTHFIAQRRADGLYEGDILLSRQQLRILTRRGKRRGPRQAQKTWKFPANLWKDAPIPYSFDKSFPTRRIRAVREAVKFWEEHTCIRFEEDGKGTDRLRFINGAGCWSMVGKAGGEQKISIGAGCDWLGTIAHELAHAFGIWHTQSRYDRDRYVMVNRANILGRQLYNFNVQQKDQTDLYWIPYEFGSVMHYAENDFAHDYNQPSLIAREGYEKLQHSMSGHMPSFYDVHLINQYYSCYDKCPLRFGCENGGKQDVNDCTKCQCPPGYGGPYCQYESTSGCDEVHTIDAHGKNFSTTAGHRGLWQIGFNECSILLKSATPGRRIELKVTSEAGFKSWNCYGAAVDVRYRKDPAFTGVRMCKPWTSFPEVTSEADHMVIHVYARINYVNFNFTARQI